MKPRRIHKLNAIACAFSSAIVFTMVATKPCAQAAILTWDADPGTVGVQGGTGNWDGITTNWTTDNGATNEVWADGNDAVLGGGENATLNVDTGSISAQELYVGYTGNGVLNLSNGTVSNTKGFIGVNSPSVSSANITGGQWDNTGELTVGYGGTGSLDISGNGTVNSAGAFFGYLAASDGNTATIAGSGASWTSNNTFYLGHDGSNNTVTVSDGALLANGNADFLIGTNAGSDNNKLTVNGTGSRFTSNGTFYVGRSGTGNQFEVLAGGSATSRNVRIGGGTGSNGTTENNVVTVDGAGSLWNVTGTMRIGSSGDNSTLTISNGGNVTTTGNSFLGYDTGSDNNLVTITGANSTWTANNLYIGRSGVNNTVTVENDGTLSANNILLGDLAGSSGALKIGTGSNATVLAAQISEGSGNGTVTFNSGTLRLTGDQANLFSDFETGDVTLIGSGGGTIDTQAFSVATGYALSGNGSLTKQGTGTLTLSGANTYTGTTTINEGILELTGSLASPTIGISLGGTLNNVNGGFDDFAAVTNAGTLRLGVSDTVASLSNSGLIDITASVFSGSDLGFVAGTIDLNAGSQLLLSNSILEVGEIADIFDGTITGFFSGISDLASDLRFSMNYLTGQIQALPGVLPPTQYSNTIYNLNRNQTWTAGALFEDTYTSVPIDTNFRKVYFDDYGPSANVVAGPTEFFVWDMDPGTGLDADPALAQLVSAMTAIQSTYSVALDGSILVGAAGKAIIDQLSPEVHRGMVDYTEQALRSHVRDGVDAAPISKIGKTQVFATLQTSDQGVDSSDNNANYDLDMVSLTTGVRYDIDKRFQIGGLLGMDDGSIEGALVDTDAQGIVGGIFGRYLVDEASNTRVTASVSYGSFDYDSNRHSFGGDADADSISSDAFELALGVSTVAFKKDGFRVVPNATLRYMAGSVDGFEEDGPGIALRVEEQDLDSVLLDLGVDFEYQAQKNLLLIGRIGYVTDFEDSDNSVGARFAASGPDASPFTVSAPGIEDEAFVLGLGTYYDFSESTRVSLTYRGEFRTHSEYTQSIGIGASFGF